MPNNGGIVKVNISSCNIENDQADMEIHMYNLYTLSKYEHLDTGS